MDVAQVPLNAERRPPRHVISARRVQVHRSAPSANGAATQVAVLGDLDSTGGLAIIEAWGVELTFAPTWMVLDLRRVGFCNAAGLRAMEVVLSSAAEHRVVLRLLVQPHLAWLLHLVGLDPHRRAEVATASDHVGTDGGLGPARRR